MSRKYLWLGVALALLGGAAGFFSVALFSPVYKARIMLEVQGINDSFLKMRMLEASIYDPSQVNIQTEIQLLRGTAFLRRVMDRLQLETIPPAPIRNDIFSRLRRHLRSSTQDPMGVMKDGLLLAFQTFDARPINNTRIIEISCDSNNPELAANFVNTVANEYVEQNLQTRSRSAQRTSQWLAGQLEETHTKMQEAEQKLQEFVQSSGNLFVAQENTLADSKLRELQGQLSAIQADRIAKQARHEMVSKSPPEALPDVLDDATLRGYQSRITELRRELVSLTTTLTPTHYKATRIEAQIAEVQAALNKEVANIIQRIRNDYEAALRREKLLSAAYSSQAGQVSSQASKAAQFNALKREVDILRQTYNAMLMQANEAGIASSVPMSSLRLVEPAAPPAEPYKPRPVLNIGFGVIAGLFFSAGIAFIREKSDRSVRVPGCARSLLNVPELGVIPSIEMVSPKRLYPPSSWRLRGPEKPRDVVPVSNGRPLQLAPGQGADLLAESFRVTLASLMRGNEQGRRPQVILVTSPGPGEGKTTVVSNLGAALAETGRRVLLIDADYRRPRLDKVFETPNTWGLTSLLAEDKGLADAPGEFGLATSIHGLFVLPNGPSPESIPKAMYSPNVSKLLGRLREKFDTILIDAPPMLLFADARVMIEFVDGVVLVLRSGVTERADVLEAYQQLYEDGAILLGTILNGWKAPAGKSRYYHYRYYSTDRNGQVVQ